MNIIEKIQIQEILENYSDKITDIQTIYIGGGMPSILSENNIEKLFNDS